MFALLKIELRKALTNKFFIITAVIATVVALLSALNCISRYINVQALLEKSKEIFGGKVYSNPFLPTDSLFTYWIGGETNSMYYSLFYLLIPLFAAFPYGWSYFMETKSGYIKNVITRTTKSKYFIAKYAAVFTAGGLAVTVPVVINLMVVALFVPARMTSVVYDQYIFVPPTQMWSETAFTHPYIYVLMFVALTFVFSGLIAGLCVAVSFVIRNRVAVVLTPLFLMLGLNFVNTYSDKWELSPINFLHATVIKNPTNGYIVLAEAVALFAIGFGITLWRGSKKDVF